MLTGRGSLPPRRLKVEFYDGQGTRHTLTVEGHLTREKAARILDYVELMGGVAASASHERDLQASPRSKFERVYALVFNRFREATFLSKDLKRAYAEVYGEEVSLSMISTYLARLADRGLLLRSGSSSEWRYSVRPAALSQAGV